MDMLLGHRTRRSQPGSEDSQSLAWREMAVPCSTQSYEGLEAGEDRRDMAVHRGGVSGGDWRLKNEERGIEGAWGAIERNLRRQMCKGSPHGEHWREKQARGNR